MGRILTGMITTEDLFSALADRTTRCLAADALLVSTYEAVSDLASVVFQSGERQPETLPSYPGRSCMAIRDRRPVLHLAGDPAAACAAAGLDSRDRPALCAPVLRQGKVVGSITALGKQGSVFDAGDLDFLGGLADMVTRAPAFASEGHGSDREFNALADRVLTAVAALQTDEAFEHATTAARDIAAADGAALWIARSGGDLEVVFSVGVAQRLGERITPTPALFRSLADAGSPLRVADDEEPADKQLAGLARTLPTLVAPLIADGRVLGALTVGFDAHEPGKAVPARLARLAGLAAVAAAHARLHEQIGALALIDPLTGIPNRRHLALYLEKEFAAARRGRNLTVLLFELDDFKAFASERGRAAADAVLRAFGEILVQHTRAMNLAAHYDDGSFVVALADADRRAGFIHASRIARAIEAHPLLGPSGIHASVGISSFTPRLKSFDDMLRRARTDLDARRAGQGRLTL